MHTCSWKPDQGIDQEVFPNCRITEAFRCEAKFISKIQKGIFTNNTLLKFLDLSGNPLPQLLTGTFTPLINLRKLSLLNLTVKVSCQNLLTGLKLSLLEVDHHELCCLVDDATICSETPPWYFSCADLLFSRVMRGVFIAVYLTIFLLNTISIALLKVSFQKGLEKSGAYGSTVASINGTDLVYSALLIVFWGADLKFQGNFGVSSTERRTSSGCYIVFGLFIFFNSNSPFLLAFFAFSRLVLVKYPLETRLKETKFVLGSILLISINSLVLSVLLTIYSW